MVIKMQRIVLKLSGEALAGEKKTGFDEATVTAVAKQVKEIVDSGIQVGILQYPFFDMNADDAFNYEVYWTLV